MEKNCVFQVAIEHKQKYYLSPQNFVLAKSGENHLFLDITQK